jgi:hypothetical protein
MPKHFIYIPNIRRSGTHRVDTPATEASCALNGIRIAVDDGFVLDASFRHICNTAALELDALVRSRKEPV